MAPTTFEKDICRDHGTRSDSNRNRDDPIGRLTNAFMITKLLRRYSSTKTGVAIKSMKDGLRKRVKKRRADTSDSEEEGEDDWTPKRSKVVPKKKPLFTEPITTVICDIEGTTAPISFVHDILFPYVLEHLESFLTENYDDPELQKYLTGLNTLVLLDNQSSQDVAEGLAGLEKIDGSKKETVQSYAKYVQLQMSSDRKVGPLKDLQGYMWKSAYETGEIQGVVYKDVKKAFDHWKSAEKEIYIYSSGSIAAQKLLFGYSDQGDLLSYFSGHFDTTIGLKTEAKSYIDIATEIGKPPSEILFLTDSLLGILP